MKSSPHFQKKALTLALLSLLTLPLPYGLRAQEGSTHEAMEPLAVQRFPIRTEEGPVLAGPPRVGEYLGSVGPWAAWLGFETGEGEVWAHPLKIAREISLSFKIPQYSDPIPGASVARWVESRPEVMTVSYSHAAFQVRQHILAPREEPGVLLLLEADAVDELEIHVEFQPVLQYAWPGGMGGQYLYWDEGNRAFVLSESRRERNAVIGSPWATRASAHPAHRLAEAPSTFVIPVDRNRAASEFIPIAIIGGEMPREQVIQHYRNLIRKAQEHYLENRAWARKIGEQLVSLTVDGPSAQTGPSDSIPSLFPASLEWAKVNLEEQRSCNPHLGCGLVAGWGPSGTSLRPGFGWYFGGDAAINSLAMDATGQWAGVAEGLRFLARYQREDGKIPHEISQSAGTISWFDDFPYAYYHADTTPYWIVALWRYWRASGDDELVRELWSTFQKAFEWCLTVETDGDGIIENTTGGLGAIEVGGLGEGMHQDIYLAAVWLEALRGASEMGDFMDAPDLASRAKEIRAKAAETLNARYWRAEEGHLAFGILQDGSTNDNLTAWPGTALAFGLVERPQAEGTLRALARDAISSSWGARLLSTESDLFDPLHYNNGAVWPFMTGFVSWAQYRYRRPWAGSHLLRALHQLTFHFSRGRHPENLSGAYYQTMDATVPHQFFATSMLVTPLVGGLLGWEPDAPQGRATLAPQPPPSWEGMEVENLRVGDNRIRLTYHRNGEGIDVTVILEGPPLLLTYIQGIPLGANAVTLDADAPLLEETLVQGVHDQLFRTEISLTEGVAVNLQYSWEGGLMVEGPRQSLGVGRSSGGLRVLDFTREGEEWVLFMEGDGGATHDLTLRGRGIVTEEGESWGPEGSHGLFTIPVSFPGEGRALRTLRLRRGN